MQIPRRSATKRKAGGAGSTQRGRGRRGVCDKGTWPWHRHRPRRPGSPATVITPTVRAQPVATLSPNPDQAQPQPEL
eukprot:2084215-Prymnesium_polylepis.1